MKRHTIGVLGGTGFVGTHLCAALVKAGHTVRVLSRRPERNKTLTVLPTLSLVAGDPNQKTGIENLLQTCDIAINLVGILNEKGHNGREFKHVHVGIPLKLAQVCQQLGIKRILHMSALGADAKQGTSFYLRTKGEGVDRLHHDCQGIAHVTSFHPSIIFGPGDGFFQRFADMLQWPIPFLPLPCPQTPYAPIYVNDVVQMFVQSLDRLSTYGQRYELCGPKVYTFYDLVLYIKHLLGKRCKIIRLNRFFSHLQAVVSEYVPGKPFSRDNFNSMQTSSVCTQPIPKIFDLDLHHVETIVPMYVGKNAMQDKYAIIRKHAGAHQNIQH